MNISQAAGIADLPVKTLRYYEDIGLVVPARRENGYRDYANEDLARLRLIGRARKLGFSIEECRNLLALQADKSRASADVKRIAQAHLREIDEKIEELQALRSDLAPLVAACKGDDSAECAILKDLEQPH
ncbi:Cu(I)-responsive transcriptional regulator [Cohaesibacter marisflavi]|uniref:Cu(I)-responsive transcriptional regulator n=1 Tax=Cohaesibacter marisflavi TaxID=655353 RepID=A0A1I5K4X9_9HYPH|nr:Cu(I)-responsive transcriptional regulator [Cohaesibacter marisflavi]SFO79671.1 Cu(I)-responsive transcriptional regulator [Cohaesibacter marisflavi]